jgi:hypothetical protein
MVEKKPLQLCLTKLLKKEKFLYHIADAIQ